MEQWEKEARNWASQGHGMTSDEAREALAEIDRLRAQVAAVEARGIVGVARCAHQCDATAFIREGDTWQVLNGWLLTTGSGWACPEHRDHS